MASNAKMIDLDAIKRSQIPHGEVESEQAKIDASRAESEAAEAAAHTGDAPKKDEPQTADERGMPDQAKGPASLSEPVSVPTPTPSAPATGLPRKALQIVPTVAQEPHFLKLARGPEHFPNHPQHVAEELGRLVACQFIEDMAGVHLLKPYKFRKGEVFALPKWFALEHPLKIVIKE